MSGTRNTALIVSLAQDVVTQIAPNELPLFPSISADYATEPDRIFREQIAKDKSLGFGPGGLDPVLTTAILLIVQQALAQIGADATEKGVGAFFRRLRKKFSKRSASNAQDHKTGLTEFSSADLLLIQNYIYEAAIQRKFTEANAKQFAYTVVGRLATSKRETENTK